MSFSKHLKDILATHEAVKLKPRGKGTPKKEVVEEKPIDKGQIILRIDDQYGHHIIRKHAHGYTIEGYAERPENYQKPPSYFFPYPEEEVAKEFAEQGKEFRVG